MSIHCAEQAFLFTDYVRLLKYGDSLYRCKELKRAALVSQQLVTAATLHCMVAKQ